MIAVPYGPSLQWGKQTKSHVEHIWMEVQSLLHDVSANAVMSDVTVMWVCLRSCYSKMSGCWGMDITAWVPENSSWYEHILRIFNKTFLCQKSRSFIKCLERRKESPWKWFLEISKTQESEVFKHLSLYLVFPVQAQKLRMPMHLKKMPSSIAKNSALIKISIQQRTLQGWGGWQTEQWVPRYNFPYHLHTLKSLGGKVLFCINYR